MDGSPDVRMLPKVFTGRRPFSELTASVVISKIIDGEQPARPHEGQEFGLTDSIWDMAVRCWHKNPAQRPTMTEVVRLVREWPVLSISPGINIMTCFPQLQGGCFVD